MISSWQCKRCGHTNSGATLKCTECGTSKFYPSYPLSIEKQTKRTE